MVTSSLQQRLGTDNTPDKRSERSRKNNRVIMRTVHREMCMLLTRMCSVGIDIYSLNIHRVVEISYYSGGVMFIVHRCRAKNRNRIER